MIIGLIGEKLSGKDTAAKYFESKYNAAHIRHSQLLDEILDILDLPKSRRNEIDLGMGLRKTFGDGVLGKALARRVKDSKTETVVINGIRFQDEVDNAKALGAKIIYITAPKELRYKRFMERAEKTDDGTGSQDDFNTQEHEPTEVQIPALGSQADLRIDNVGTQDDLYKKLDDIISKFNF